MKHNIGGITPRDDLKIEMKCGCTKCATEKTWIEINKDGRKFIISSIYRHGNSNYKHFVSALQKSISTLDPKDTVILAGDFNINLLNIHHEDTLD